MTSQNPLICGQRGRKEVSEVQLCNSKWCSNSHWGRVEIFLSVFQNGAESARGPFPETIDQLDS